MSKQNNTNEPVVGYAYERCTELNFDMKAPLDAVSPDVLQFGYGFRIVPVDDDKVSITINVDYFIDKKPVFSHGSEHIFKFLDRSVAFDFIEDGYRDKVGMMPLLLGLAYNTARGMIAMRAVGTALVSFPIPIINPTEALKRAGKQQ